MLQTPDILPVGPETKVDLLVLWPHLLACGPHTLWPHLIVFTSTSLHALHGRHIYGWVAHCCWPVHKPFWSWPTNLAICLLLMSCIFLASILRKPCRLLLAYQASRHRCRCACPGGIHTPASASLAFQSLLYRLAYQFRPSPRVVTSVKYASSFLYVSIAAHSPSFLT